MQDFVYSNDSLVEEWLFSTFLSGKSNFLHMRRKHASVANKEITLGQKFASVASTNKVGGGGGIFFLTLTVRRPFHRKDFEWRGYRITGLLSEETEALHAKLSKRVEEATNNYFAAVDFL